MNTLSIVSPVYGDKKNVILLYEAIKKALGKLDLDYEIILVNDCCPYGSGEEIEKIAQIDKRVKFIDFSRNFGQHNAIKAGIDYSKGDYVVVMDCDMQDDPEDIILMYEKIKEGYDIVFGIRKERIDKISKKLISKIFRLFERYLSEYVSPYDHGNFCIITKQVADEFKKINNVNFHFRTIIYYLGFKTGNIDIVKHKRAEGKSCYNLAKAFKLATRRIIANSNKPIILGGFCIFLMFCASCTTFIKFVYDIINNNSIKFDILMLSIFVIATLLFTYLLILGIYIGATFSESKHKPLYIVKRTMNI